MNEGKKNLEKEKMSVVRTKREIYLPVRKL